MITGRLTAGHRLFPHRIIYLLIILVPMLLPTTDSYAHHSFAVHFVPEKMISVSGTVTRFRFANPHGVIFFTVVDENGEEQKWKGETNSPSILKRRGWTSESLKPGQEITVTGWPARNGSYLIRVSTITFANGEELLGQPARAPLGND